MNPANTVRVLCVGPGLAGVRTTVQRLGADVGALPPLSDVELVRHKRLGFTMRTRAGTEMQIFSDVRTPYWIHSLAAAAGDEPSIGIASDFRAHLDYLGRVDGIIFVADSQIERREANGEGVESLARNLAEVNRKRDDVPVVFQCNKQDLSNARAPEEMKSELVWPRCVHVGASARKGIGMANVLEALLAMLPATSA